MASRRKLTPEQRSENAAIAALTRWGKEDPAANAARGQAGFLAKFEREARAADPTASDAEIARRALRLRSAHMRRMAVNRERARQNRKAAQATP